jgi:hypothetical protein
MYVKLGALSERSIVVAESRVLIRIFRPKGKEAEKVTTAAMNFVTSNPH